MATPEHLTSSTTMHTPEDDEEWQRIHQLLKGLLSIEMDTRFQDESHHPRSSWLVVHVTQVESPEPYRSSLHSKRVADALNAVATLCASAEKLRFNDAQHLVFWTRVLCSQMMMHEPFLADEVPVWWFAKHTRDREIRIKLHWAERPLDKIVLRRLRLFMDSQVSEYGGGGEQQIRPRPMKIALCVTKVKLEMSLLAETLAPTSTTCGRDEQWRRFKPSLASLEIRDIELSANHLLSLAQRVYPRARRIDELRLEAIFSSSDPSVPLSKRYLLGLQRVLVAAMATHGSWPSSSNAPVGISLAYNALDTAHLQLLEDALRGAGRVVRSLSLKYALLPPQGVDTLPESLVMALGRIIFVTSQCGETQRGSRELDLTGRSLQESEVAILRKCRRVIGQTQQWIVQTRFDRVILDGDVDKRLPAYDSECSYDDASLLSMLCARATSVSLRQRPRRTSTPSSSTTSKWSTRFRFLEVTRLSLEGSRSLFNDKSFWTALGDQLLRVETLHVGFTQCFPGNMQLILSELLALAPNLRLRQLVLSGNRLDANDLELLQRLLDKTPSLELVELDGFPVLSMIHEMEEFGAARQALVQAHDGVRLAATIPMSAPAKLAFLSVITRALNRHTVLERSVCDRIFMYASYVQPAQRHLVLHPFRLMEDMM